MKKAKECFLDLDLDGEKNALSLAPTLSPTKALKKKKRDSETDYKKGPL
jgi:hypothetical protein